MIGAMLYSMDSRTPEEKYEEYIKIFGEGQKHSQPSPITEQKLANLESQIKVIIHLIKELAESTKEITHKLKN